jgi:hypothetical protein
MPRARRLAGLLLGRVRFRPRRGVGRGQVVEALAGVLAVTAPSSPHGRLLAAALAPAPTGPRRRPTGPSPQQQAVRRLLERGEPPTPEGVAGELACMEQHRAALQRRAARVRALLEDGTHGSRAAAMVAARWRTAGAGPTWRELGDAMGWRKLDREALIRGLEREGWLVTGTKQRSLRPGPRLRGLSAEQAWAQSAPHTQTTPDRARPQRARQASPGPRRASGQEALEDIARLMSARPRPR